MQYDSFEYAHIQDLYPGLPGVSTLDRETPDPEIQASLGGDSIVAPNENHNHITMWLSAAVVFIVLWHILK